MTPQEIAHILVHGYIKACSELDACQVVLTLATDEDGPCVDILIASDTPLTAELLTLVT